MESGDYMKKLLTEAMPNLKEEKLEKTIRQLHHKPILLKAESSGTYFKKKSKQKKTKVKAMPTRPAKVENCKYNDFNSLRQLWTEYMQELLSYDKGGVDIRKMQELMLKADFHGADIKVVKAKCKTYESIQGTILTESKNMFQIVTKNNKVLRIPKPNSVFMIQFFEHNIYIFGDQFCLRPAHRLTKKFKNFTPKINLI